MNKKINKKLRKVLTGAGSIAAVAGVAGGMTTVLTNQVGSDFGNKLFNVHSRNHEYYAGAEGMKWTVPSWDISAEGHNYSLQIIVNGLDEDGNNLGKIGSRDIDVNYHYNGDFKQTSIIGEEIALDYPGNPDRKLKITDIASIQFQTTWVVSSANVLGAETQFSSFDVAIPLERLRAENTIEDTTIYLNSMSLNLLITNNVKPNGYLPFVYDVIIQNGIYPESFGFEVVQ